MLPIGEKPSSVMTGTNRIHSKKPESTYELIEGMYPQLKYIELFARNTPRKGWVKWGNEVGKYE
jgi:N6-adenosine-specific RNA methylase IME4